MPICVKEFQGNKRNNQAKMKGNEHIRGLISWDFIFFQKGHARHTNNMFQYMPSSNVCQVLMFVNAILCQGVPGHARDYRSC